MKCSIKFDGQTATVYDWTPTCDELLGFALQLLPDEKRSRRHSTTLLRGFHLSNYLQQNGVEVTVQISDPSEHARITVWNEKLTTLRTDITETEVHEFLEQMRLEYRPLQRRGVKKILQSHFALLAAGCGNGKTLMNLSAIQFGKNKHGKTLCVIVLPQSCAGEYQKELGRFRGYFDLTVLNTCGLSPKEARSKVDSNDSDVIIVSVDSLGALADAIKNQLLDHRGESILILEEGHSIKNVSSKRSQAVQGIAPLFDRVIISTATPLPLGPKDLRGYIATVGIPQPEALYESDIPLRDFDFLKGVAFITDEEDIPFAPLVSANIEYSDLEELDHKILEEVNAELASGRKVVIFTATNAALVRAFELFPGVGKTVLSGSYAVSDIHSDRLESGRNTALQGDAIERFNGDPECKILIANYRVGSTGLNLQYSHARMAIFYEITNSGADFFQSKYRIRRPTVFPAEGFKYLYAIPLDPQQRRKVNRQFMKQANQARILKTIKALTARSA